MVRISVVVPCYKVESYLPKCVDSLIGQTYSNIEIILVDDGSPDASGEICDAYAAQDHRVHVIHKQNGGVSAARNDGLLAATGDYVLFCDGDDWMPIDACEHLAVEAEKSNADVIWGDIWRCWDNRDEYMRFFAHPFCTEDTSFIQELVKTNFYYTYCPSVPLENRADGCYGGPWNKAVKRKLLLEHAIRFDLRVKGIYDDVLYSAYVLANAKKIAYIGKPVYNYRQVRNSMTHVFKKNILEVNDAIFTAWEEFLQAYDPENTLRKAYYANVIRRLDHALEVYFFSSSNPTSIRERKAGLKDILKHQVYYQAVRNVDRNKLSKRHRVECSFAAHNQISALWLVYSVNRWLKSRNS